MFQASKSSPPTRHLRLPKQSAIPGIGDIEFIMEESRKTPGKAVELPFYLPNNKQLEFVLSVICQTEKGDPDWAISQISSKGLDLLWRHASNDLSLICNLVNNSASGTNEVQDVVSPNAIMGMRDDVVEKGAGKDGAGGTRSSTTTSGATTSISQGPKPIMEGDLKNLPITNLLHSIRQGKMTGKLVVKNLVEECQIYFVEGEPVHGVFKDILGNTVVIELVTWTKGEYQFWQSDSSTTDTKTIDEPLDVLLKQGINLLNQSKYLETSGLHFESCLIKKNTMISEEEFKTRIQKGTPIEMAKQLDFYELIDNRSTLFDLLRKRSLSKLEWVPIIFNLVSCGLVHITDQAPQSSRFANLKMLGIDENSVQKVSKNFLQPETDILTYPAFLYFLDQEYLRYEYFNFPFSLVVFSLGYRRPDATGGTVESLAPLAIRRAMQRISLVKRRIDLLSHFETADYAILLPNTNAVAAGALASKVAEVLREAPLSSDMDARNLALAFGVAAVPEDYQQLDKVLIAATKARESAKKGQRRVVLAREAINQGTT